MISTSLGGDLGPLLGPENLREERSGLGEKSTPKGKGLTGDGAPVGGLRDRDRQRRALLAKSEHLGGCGAASGLRDARKVNVGAACRRGAQVRSWTREEAMAGSQAGGMACSPPLRRELLGLHERPPPPGTLREGAEPGEGWRRRGNLRWTSSWRLPCGGPHPSPWGQGNHFPLPTKKYISSAAGTQGWAAPS